MRKVPDLVFVVDVSREEAAVHEANLLKIPVVALVDTNCNTQGIDYVIPSNDDAIRAIKLLVAKVADAVLEGKAMRKEEDEAETAPMAADGSAEPARMRQAVKLVETDEEPEEGALLGESTLAKLSASRQPEDTIREAPVPIEPPAVEEPAAEPSASEASPAETPASEPPSDGGQEPAAS
jgi:small subunit ribosomal protein S2